MTPFYRTFHLSAARPVYVWGQLVYTVGMFALAVTRHPSAVILLSPTAGIMYATLFTMPYLLVAHYHTSGEVRPNIIVLNRILYHLLLRTRLLGTMYK